MSRLVTGMVAASRQARVILENRADPDEDGVLQSLERLDLTNLDEDCDEAAIDALCARAHTPHGPVDAVCVWPAFVDPGPCPCQERNEICRRTALAPGAGIQPWLASREECCLDDVVSFAACHGPSVVALI